MTIKLVSQSSPEEATFETFWKWYPKKEGKALAKAKFNKITNGGLATRTLDKDSGTYEEIELSATADEIVEGAKRFVKSQIDPMTHKIRDGGKYIPQPSRWLNQGRWMDGE